jgi:FG-GAP-like repeat
LAEWLGRSRTDSVPNLTRGLKARLKATPELPDDLAEILRRATAPTAEAWHRRLGSNYGDFDNDGFLDMYQGTGEPNLCTLIPNRMFKNVGGERFAEITASSGTGNLQKGHGVACGDWDRDGDVDLFVQMGRGRQRRQVSQHSR